MVLSSSFVSSRECEALRSRFRFCSILKSPDSLKDTYTWYSTLLNNSVTRVTPRSENGERVDNPSCSPSTGLSIPRILFVLSLGKLATETELFLNTLDP